MRSEGQDFLNTTIWEIYNNRPKNLTGDELSRYVCKHVFYRLKDFIWENNFGHLPLRRLKRNQESQKHLDVIDIIEPWSAIDNVILLDTLYTAATDELERDILELKMQGYSAYEVRQILNITQRVYFYRWNKIRNRFTFLNEERR